MSDASDIPFPSISVHTVVQILRALDLVESDQLPELLRVVRSHVALEESLMWPLIYRIAVRASVGAAHKDSTDQDQTKCAQKSVAEYLSRADAQDDARNFR